MMPRFFRMRYFVWVFAPVAAFLIYLILGLPHFIWSYQWQDKGCSYGDFKSRIYTRCTLLGPYGRFVIHPANGKCPWFKFYKREG